MLRPRLRFLTVVLASAMLVAQDPTTVTAAEVEAKARVAAELTDIDEATKKTIEEIYLAAVEFAKASATSRANAAAAQEAEKSAPALLTTERERLARPLEEPPTAAALAGLDFAGLEELLRTVKTTHDKASAELTKKEDERQRRTKRLAELPSAIAANREELAKLQASPIENAAEDPATLQEARTIRRTTRLQALRAHLAELEAEQRQYVTETELLTVQRDVLDRAATRHSQIRELVDKAVQARREADAGVAAKEAERQLLEVSKTLEPLARQNQDLAESRTQWVDSLTEARADRDAAQKLKKRIEDRFADIDKRIAAVGTMTDAIGLQLRQEKAQMPPIRRYLANIDARRSEFDRVQIELIDFEEGRKRFFNQRDEIVQREIENAREPLSAAVRARVEAEGRVLLGKREEYFAGLGETLREYQKVLSELDSEENQLVELIRSKTQFVNQLVLWIRSSVPVWKTDWGTVAASVGWFFQADNWHAGWAALGESASRRPVRFLLLTLLSLALIFAARPLRRRITLLGKEAAKNRTTSFQPTAWALVATVLASLGWPLLLWHLATLVSGAPEVSGFPLAVATGLARAAVLFAAMELVRQIMRPHGLAEAHLRWPAPRTRLFRRNLLWFGPVVLPLLFALRALTTNADPKWGFMLDRFVLIAILTAIAIFQARVLHPARGALTGREAPGGVWRHTRLWSAVGLGVPTALAIVAAAGYHFSALELLYRLENSLGVVGLAVLTHGLGMRWMLLAKRRLAMAQAKARREALKAKEGELGQDIQTDSMQLPEETLSLASVDAQSRKLFGSALLLLVMLSLWGIWVDVLPALRALEQIAVSGTPGAEDAVTLASLLLALFVLVVTCIAARNIPGLLELLVLQRLRIHAGERHAVTTLVRYLIVTIGVVLTFSSLGIGWNKVQWLVAAVSVGLGFGLQEIFANFVSGLIILFERQIRIGDLVTVGEVDGYVTRIRMRATTIMDFDRKEMIVPNKEFVTSRLINWTLTDPVTRVIVSVGVAYGSDTELARKLLLKVAAENKRVLEDPSPSAIFRRFGDSTLDLDLRVFIASRELWPAVVNSLHGMIDREFKRANIEIAFPQRDLHVRTLGPLEKLTEKRPDPDPS